MSSFEELDALSSEELHDRAFQHAERHLDLKFFWDLLQYTPAAEAETGDVEWAEGDAQRATSQLTDAVARRPELKDAMRPVYIDYLLKHPDA